MRRLLVCLLLVSITGACGDGNPAGYADAKTACTSLKSSEDPTANAAGLINLAVGAAHEASQKNRHYAEFDSDVSAFAQVAGRPGQAALAAFQVVSGEMQHQCAGFGVDLGF